MDNSAIQLKDNQDCWLLARGKLDNCTKFLLNMVPSSYHSRASIGLRRSTDQDACVEQYEQWAL